MNKEDQIAYLNTIKPFINLKAICEDYNKRHSPAIDYNNLRAVLNGVSKTRLSSDRLESFIKYLYEDLFPNIFNIEKMQVQLQQDSLKKIMDSYATKMSSEILKEFENEIQNK